MSTLQENQRKRTLWNASWQEVLSEDEIRKYPEEWDWTGICSNQSLSPQFIRDHSEYMDWEETTKNQQLTYDLLVDFGTHLDFALVQKYQNFPEEELSTYVSFF